MFDIGAGELLGLMVLGLLLFGPDRLPGIASDAARMIGKVRAFASSATSELKESLGPELTDLAQNRRVTGEKITSALLGEEPTKPAEPRIDPDAT